MKVADADFSTVKGLSNFFLVHCLMFQREPALKNHTSYWSVGKFF